MGQSNGKRNMWVVDGLASNDNADIIIDNTMAYPSALAITEDYQLVYKAWVIAQIGNGNTATRLNYPAGTALPIVLSSFQTAYSIYGSNPKFKARKITGGALLTASIINAATSAANGIYTAQAIVRNTGVYNSTGCGRNATVTVVVSGGVVTSVTPVAGGDSFYVGDTFEVAAVPGAVFGVATNGEIYYTDVTPNSIVIGEVTDLLPDSVTLSFDDDGTGHLQDNLQLIISK